MYHILILADPHYSDMFTRSLPELLYFALFYVIVADRRLRDNRRDYLALQWIYI